MKNLKRIATGALFLGLLVFGWQFAARNDEPVSVDLLFARVDGGVGWQVFIGAFLGGAGLMGLGAVFMSIRNGLLNRRYRKTIANLEAEVHHLRNLPLAVEDLTGEGRDGDLGSEVGHAGQGL